MLKNQALLLLKTPCLPGKIVRNSHKPIFFMNLWPFVRKSTSQLLWENETKTQQQLCSKLEGERSYRICGKPDAVIFINTTYGI